MRYPTTTGADIEDLSAQEHRHAEVDDEVQQHGVGRDRCRLRLEMREFDVTAVVLDQHGED
jgi:hypothetical protein